MLNFQTQCVRTLFFYKCVTNVDRVFAHNYFTIMLSILTFQEQGIRTSVLSMLTFQAQGVRNNYFTSVLPMLTFQAQGVRTQSFYLQVCYQC